MRLANYEFAEEIDKIDWLNSIQMKVGLPYFGGKSIIGRYIFNNIFNLSVEMKKQGNTPEIFIDAFTGGGKMGLSVPYGWYDTIVINDLDYGVYSYYKCCKENHIALIEMIERIGDVMCKDLFYMSAYLRKFGKNVEKWEGGGKVADDEVLDPLAAGALTYWVTSAAFNNITAPDSTTYNLCRVIVDEDGNATDDATADVQYEERKKEQEKIKKIILKAKKNITKLHEQLNRMDYRIENLDYKELIKKYNGKEYSDLQGEKHPADKELGRKNKLWYFDPPYHPWCLYAGEDAPYAETFTEEMANGMVDILAGEREEEYGSIDYFIKSDYDPKYILDVARRDVEDSEIKQERRNWYKKLLQMEAGDNTSNTDVDEHPWTPNMVSNIFSKLETFPYCKICVGGFDKGAVQGDGKKDVGQEYIWCRGFPKGYEEIEGVQAKE